ncbi:transposase [Streptomyces sp. NPDC051993]|uniref:transposase n=1 Tax=unclassified Streptomyces TaxID=2593676 RepID=UPI00342996E3
MAQTLTVSRFATSDRYAAYTSTTPVPVSSSNTQRHRLSRGGNRQPNAALHTIALKTGRSPTRCRTPVEMWAAQVSAVGKYV